MKSIVVNLFGGPNVGKTTMALAISAELAFSSIRVEFVEEFAKANVIEKNISVLKNQHLIFAEQLRKISRVHSEGMVIVVDGPLLNSLVYNTDLTTSHFKQDVLEVFQSFDNLNILIDRNKDLPFVPFGRRQNNVSESIVIDQRVMQMLKENCIPFQRNLSSRENALIIADEIKRMIVQ